MTTYTLPPEWAPQSAVQLTWPHAHGDWADNLPTVEPVFVALAQHISQREIVLIACYDPAHRQHIQNLLAAAQVPASKIRLHIAPSNDSWTRDHGPITVFDGQQPRLLDFGFNGWGLKYPAYHDNQITRQLHAQVAFGDTPLSSVGLVLEGGAIEVDGEGTLLTTRACLLSPNRNPHLDQAAIEQALGQWLGVDRVLWLSHGYLAGDDTDSHIDTLARFCDAHSIAYVTCDDPSDEHYPALQAMQAELQALRDRAGQPYRLIALPWPAAQHNSAGRRLPATYANFLIINGAVLVPTYNDPQDALALAQLATAFPGRNIIGIHCTPLIQQFGSLHCVTMQIPQGVL